MQMRAISVYILVLYLAVGLAMRYAHAETLPHYDLDSKTYFSAQIIEGTLQNVDASPHDAATFLVSRVLKGDFKIGQVIELDGLQFYSKSTDNHSFNTQPLEQGDHLLLFIASPKNDRLGHATKLGTYFIVPSGVDLLKSEKVYPFLQIMNPGDYVAEPKERIESLAEYRAAIIDSAKRQDAISKRLTGNLTIADTPWLLSLLPNDKSGDRGWRYAAKIDVVKGLAEVASEDTLVQLLHRSDGFELRDYVSKSLATPHGQNLLYDAIKNSPTNDSARLALAYALYDTLQQSRSGTTDKKQNGISPLVRFAHLIVVVANKNDENLAGTLLLNLSYIRSYSDSENKDDKDWQNVLVLLTQLHQTTRSELIRYRIEIVTLRINEALFKTTYPTRWPVLALAEPDSNGIIAKNADKIIFSIEFMNLAPTADATTWVEFVNTATQQIFISQAAFNNLPDLNMSAWESNSSVFAQLPKDLPPGHYQVLVSFKSKERTVSQSHYFDADL